jgi:hypothetical protein
MLALVRINFPVWVLDEPAPRCAPGDPSNERALSLTDRRVPLLLLYQSLIKLGHHVGSYAAGECDLNVFWTGKQVPPSEVGRSVIVEVAWLPRSHYQVSPSGSNAMGHYARTYACRPLTADETAFIRGYLDRVQRLYARRVDEAAVERLRRRLPPEFVLFPLQLANDFNLKFSGTGLSRFYSADVNRNHELAAACIELMSPVTSLPVVFKQHPFDTTTNLRELLRGHQLVLDNADSVSAHDLFATGACKAVVSVNSNTLHEAAAWNIPAVCLGRLIWPEESERPPFKASVHDLPAVLSTRPLDDPGLLSYLHYLVRQQWTLTDFQNELMVAELVRTRGRCEPMHLRGQVGLH